MEKTITLLYNRWYRNKNAGIGREDDAFFNKDNLYSFSYIHTQKNLGMGIYPNQGLFFFLEKFIGSSVFPTFSREKKKS